MLVGADVHKVGFRCIRDEAQRCVVRENEAEALDIEALDLSVIVQGGEDLVRVEFLDEEKVARIAVHKLERGGVEAAVLEYCQYLVVVREFSEIQAVSVVV